MKSPNVPASCTFPTKIASDTPVAKEPLPILLAFSIVLKYLPDCFAAAVALARPDAMLNAGTPGTPKLIINSVILPAAVALAASSKGFILAKKSSTDSALSLSTPKSINVAPNVATPSAILNNPEGIAANIDVYHAESSLPKLKSPELDVEPLPCDACHSSKVAIDYASFLNSTNWYYFCFCLGNFFNNGFSTFVSYNIYSNF